MSDDENFELVRRFNQAWRAEDLSIFDELLAPDFVAHNGDEEVRGPDGWRQWVLETREQDGPIETGVDELIGDGSLVGERWWFRSSAGGGHGLTMHRIEDGRLRENWAVYRPEN